MFAKFHQNTRIGGLFYSHCSLKSTISNPDNVYTKSVIDSLQGSSLHSFAHFQTPMSTMSVSGRCLSLTTRLKGRFPGTRLILFTPAAAFSASFVSIVTNCWKAQTGFSKGSTSATRLAFLVVYKHRHFCPVFDKEPFLYPISRILYGIGSVFPIRRTLCQVDQVAYRGTSSRTR